MIRDIDFVERSIPLLKDIIECFISRFIDKSKFEAIKSPIPESVFLSDELSKARDLVYESAGFTFTEILSYINTLGNKKVSPSDAQRLFEMLLNKRVLELGSYLLADAYKNESPAAYLPAGNRYIITGEGMTLFIMDLVENLVFGPSYIINRYKSAIIQVLGVTNLDDDTIGTGFVIKSNGQLKIITCKHNVEGLKNVRFICDNKIVKYSKINYADDESIDCVIVDIDEDLKIEALQPSPLINVLSEVITMGYPTIPRSGDAYMMVHKGEINGIVKDYYKKDEFIIFSAKTSSGNSGSPLIDEDGSVLGIVTNEFFDKQAYLEKGKPPYYAAIPFETINSAFNLDLWGEIVRGPIGKFFGSQITKMEND